MISYTAEKALKDNEAKIPEELKKNVNEKIDALKTVKNGTDIEIIKKATEELSTEMSKIGEAMAKSSPESAGDGQGNATPEEQPPEVHDAEFKEDSPADKEEDKKEDDKPKGDQNKQ